MLKWNLQGAEHNYSSSQLFLIHFLMNFIKTNIFSVQISNHRVHFTIGEIGDQHNVLKCNVSKQITHI